MKQYNIGEVAKILNISNELLRHYERKGLITPIRDKNGYRYYDANVIAVLLGVRRYRNMGFSLEDIKTLIYGASREETQVIFSQRFREMKNDIEWRQMVMDATGQLQAELQTLPQECGNCRLCQSPAVLRITSRQNDLYDIDALSSDTLRWVDKMPVVRISPAFTADEILTGSDAVHFGYAVPLHLAKPLKLSDTPGAVELLPTLCVSVVIYSKGERYLDAKALGCALTFLDEHSLCLSANAWGITLGNYIEDGEVLRFHRIYLPVELVKK